MEILLLVILLGFFGSLLVSLIYKCFVFFSLIGFLLWWVDMIKTHGKKVYTHVMTNGQYEGYEILNDELYFEML